MIFCCLGGSGTAASQRGKHVEEDVDIEEDSSDEVFILEGSVTRGRG